MEIRTKFDIGQQVWLIYKDKIHKGHVNGIDILKNSFMQREMYKINFQLDNVIRHSNEIFDSKESLINSIE